MSWDDLRYVLAVSRHGTISDAARALQVNATTVSRRLKAIEEDKGTALFEKLKHGAVLTPAGEALVSVAETVEQLTNNLDAHIHGLDTRLEGNLCVTAADLLFNHWMSDLADFQRRYPNVQLELRSSYEMANLTQREADIAVRISKSAPPHLLGNRHVEALYAVYGHRALIESIGANAAYAAFPWVGWDLRVGRATDDYLAAHAKGAKIVMRVDRMLLMQQALSAGIGITILPCLSGDRIPDLCRIGDYFEGGVYIWVLTHPELRGTARVRAFINLVRTLIARDRALILGQCPAVQTSA